LGEIFVASNADYFAPVTMINRPILSELPDDLTTAMGIASAEPERMRFEIAAGGTYAVRLDYDMFGTVSEPDEPGLSNDKSLLDLSGQLDFQLGQKDDTAAGPRVVGLEISYRLKNSQGLRQPAREARFERLVVPHQYHAGHRFKEGGFGNPWNANVSIVPYAVTQEYMAHRVLKKMLTDIRQFAALVATGHPNGEVPLDPLGIHVSDAYATALTARNISQTDDAPVTFYVDQMSVIVEEVAGFASDSDLTLTSSIDLMQISERNNVGAQTGNGLGWTVAETLRPGLNGGESVGSAMSHLEAAAYNAGTSVTKIETLAMAERFGADIAGNLKPELENGFDVFLMSHLNDAAWFSRDPKTGMVIGRSSGGRGNDSVQMELTASQKIDMALNLADVLVCSFLAKNVMDSAVCAANGLGNLMTTFSPAATFVIVPGQILLCWAQNKPLLECVAAGAFSNAAAFNKRFSPRTAFEMSTIAASTKALLVIVGANDVVRSK
jgi:hypothetical protein